MQLQQKAFAVALLLVFEIFAGQICWRILIPDVTYSDIHYLNATCNGLDCCKCPKTINNPNNLNCDCGRFCSLLGTCCVDSPYKHMYPTFKNVDCRHHFDMNNQKYLSYPMISSCNPDLENDRTTEKLCNGNAEELNDPFLFIPVTDHVTGISYRNYYCYACNENYFEEQPVPWDLEVRSLFVTVNNPSLENVQYDPSSFSWVMDYGNGNATFISLKLIIPEELKGVLNNCFTSEIISECASNWTDFFIRIKCLNYMALTRIQKGKDTEYYRNPHCAICNYQSIENMVCEGEMVYYGYVGYGAPNDFFVGLFYLHRETNKCEDGMAYDHFAKKCRVIYRSKRRRLM